MVSAYILKRKITIYDPHVQMNATKHQKIGSQQCFQFSLFEKKKKKIPICSVMT